MMIMRLCNNNLIRYCEYTETDSSTDANSVTAFTFDEIGLLAGVHKITTIREFWMKQKL